MRKPVGYFNTTDSDLNGSGADGTSRTYALNLSSLAVTLFASPETIDLATGLPVGGSFRNADNLSLDHDGNIYIVEDRNGGADDDIWFARDLNKNSPTRVKGSRAGFRRRAGVGIHRALLRSSKPEPRVRQHSAPIQRRRPPDRDLGVAGVRAWD